MRAIQASTPQRSHSETREAHSQAVPPGRRGVLALGLRAIEFHYWAAPGKRANPCSSSATSPASACIASLVWGGTAAQSRRTGKAGGRSGNVCTYRSTDFAKPSFSVLQLSNEAATARKADLYLGEIRCRFDDVSKNTFHWDFPLDLALFSRASRNLFNISAFFASTSGRLDSISACTSGGLPRSERSTIFRYSSSTSDRCASM